MVVIQQLNDCYTDHMILALQRRDDIAAVILQQFDEYRKEMESFQRSFRAFNESVGFNESNGLNSPLRPSARNDPVVPSSTDSDCSIIPDRNQSLYTSTPPSPLSSHWNKGIIPGVD